MTAADFGAALGPLAGDALASAIGLPGVDLGCAALILSALGGRLLARARG